MRYSDVWKLWLFALSWIIQRHPSEEQIIIVTRLFGELGVAINDDTGLVVFHNLDQAPSLDQEIGEATRKWVVRARPILRGIYWHFEMRLVEMARPVNGIPLEEW